MNDPHDNAKDDRAILDSLAEEVERAREEDVPCDPSLAEEDLSDEALEGRVMTNEEHAATLAAWHESERVDAADMAKLEAMSAETESILRENAETRADLGLDTTPLPPPEPPPLAPGETATLIGTSVLGDTFDESTGEVLKDAPGWDKTTRSILNRDGLEWAGRRLRDVEEALAENHRAAAAELAELEAKLRKAQERHEKADAPLLASRAFFDAAIRVYADSHRAELLKGRRGKTARLPSGLVLAWSTKAKGGAYRWDEKMRPAERSAALVAWAQGEQVSRSEEFEPLVEPGPDVPNLEEIKKYAATIHIDGIANVFVPPGLEYVPEHEELNIKVED